MPRLLVFVGVFVESPMMDEVVRSLNKLDGLVYLCEVTGDFDLVILVSAESVEEFRSILVDQIMKIRGVKSNVSSVVLRAHKGPGYTWLQRSW